MEHPELEAYKPYEPLTLLTLVGMLSQVARSGNCQIEAEKRVVRNRWGRLCTQPTGTLIYHQRFNELDVVSYDQFTLDITAYMSVDGELTDLDFYIDQQSTICEVEDPVIHRTEYRAFKYGDGRWAIHKHIREGTAIEFADDYQGANPTPSELSVYDDQMTQVSQDDLEGVIDWLTSSDLQESRL